MFVRFKSESLPVVHILVSPPPLPTPHNPCLFLRILRERRDLPISSVRCRGRHMVERDGSDDVSERLPPRFLLDGRNVRSVDDFFHSDGVRPTIVFQLLPQQRRLQHVGKSVRWPTQVRRLLQGSVKHVHPGHARFDKKRRTGHANSRHKIVVGIV
jgi:hypothetical protein